MAVFDYKDYSSAEMLALLQTSHALAVYSALSKPLGIPVMEAMKKLQEYGIDTPLPKGTPEGWRELEPAELNLPESAKDSTGHYIIPSPITGTIETGPQAKILGQFDENGQLLKIGLSFTATNSPLDVLDYLQLNEGTIAPYMEPLLQSIKDYAQNNGLSGEDVLITGYSLGGGYTNVMARFSQTLADGFFADSDYIGHAAPVIFDNPIVFNYGYENDVVFRAAGDHETLKEAVEAAQKGLVHPDTEYGSSVDNIILYDDAYASALWPAPAFSLLNIPVAWYAHMDGVITDAITRIGNSSFYEFTEQDSTIIVANLSNIGRATRWVEDKDTVTSSHYGTSAFIIGSELSDKLKGGMAADYIDAGAGDDTIKTGTGNDRINGGEGIDTLWLDGSSSDWQAYRLSDGTLFLDEQNSHQLIQAHNVERITFDGESLSKTRPYQVNETEITDVRYNVLDRNQPIEYQTHTEGSNGNDTLKGAVVFGGAGDDILYGDVAGALLHGGEGNDVLYGHAEGGARLYGAEGNDILYARGEDNILSGGIGNDTFVFDSTGSYIISDFNQAQNENDRLLFASDLFGSERLSDFATQTGNDVTISYEQIFVVVQNADLDNVLAAGQLIA